MSSLTNPAEGEGKTGNGSISAEPVFLGHSADNRSKFGSEPGASPMKQIMNVCDEFLKRDVRVITPVVGEEVIENDIHDNAGESFAGGIEKFFCFQKHRVLVCEPIDGPMKYDAIDHALGELIQQAFRGPPGEVTQDRSDT